MHSASDGVVMMCQTFVVLFLALLQFVSAHVIKHFYSSPSFKSVSDSYSCFWYDGYILLDQGHVSVKVGTRSSFVLIPKEGTIRRSVKGGLDLTRFGGEAALFLITDQEGRFNSEDKHAACLDSIELLYSIFHTFGDGLLEEYDGFEFAFMEFGSSPHAAPVLDATVTTSFDDLDSLSVSRFLNYSLETSLNFPANTLDSSNSKIEEHSQYSDLIGYSEISSIIIESDDRDSSTSEIMAANKQDIFDENVSTDVSCDPVLSTATTFIPGEQLYHQFRHRYPYPMISLINNSKSSIVLDSAAGTVHQFGTRYLHRVPEKEMIPKTTNMTADRKCKYVYINSKVWYYHSVKSKVLECEVVNVSRSSAFSKEPFTLKCEKMNKLIQSSLNDIYPIEAMNSATLLEIMLDFEAGNHEGKKSELSNKRKRSQQEESSSNKKTASSSTEFITDNEVSLDSMNQTRVHSNSQIKVGDQVQHLSDGVPYIVLNKSGKQTKLINTITGDIVRCTSRRLSHLPISKMIPMNTKMANLSNGALCKYILPSSSVVYFSQEDSTFYPCIVEDFMKFSSVALQCVKLGVIQSKWNDVFPIEAYQTFFKDRAAIYEPAEPEMKSDSVDIISE